MSTFGDNIARLRASKGWSQREFAEMVGVTNGAVAAWESRGTLPKYDRVKEVARLFGVPVTALFSTREARAEDDGDFSSVELRVYGHIAAGTPLEMEEGDYGFPCPSRMLDRHPRAFYLEVEGESMNRVLPNGALALVGPDGALKTPQSVRVAAVAGAPARRLREIAEARRDSGVAWLSCEGAECMGTSRLIRVWRRAVEGAGLRYLPPQTLRPSWRTTMAYTLGLDASVAERLMGHLMPGVTGRHYDRPHVADLVVPLARAYAKHPYMG